MTKEGCFPNGLKRVHPVCKNLSQISFFLLIDTQHQGQDKIGFKYQSSISIGGVDY
jgi:hypothetical protein